MEDSIKNLVKAYYRLKDDIGMEQWSKDVRQMLLKEFSAEDIDSGLALKIVSLQKPLIKHKLSAEDYNLIKESTESFLQWIDSDDYHEDKIGNYTNDIFEKTMIAIYGAQVFDYINSKIR